MGCMEFMEYGDFKECLCSELVSFYGKDAQVSIKKTTGNNGRAYDGIKISLKGKGGVTPVMDAGKLYAGYCTGTINMEDCVEAVYQMAEEFECPEDIRQFAEKIRHWDSVREDIYPVLLNTRQNQGMLQDIVSMPLMDLSVAYTIRGELSRDGECRVKVSRALLEYYGISSMELHRQAVENMKKDGYRFQDIVGVMGDMLGIGREEMQPFEELGRTDMYILTNGGKRYGAAGILDKNLVKDFAGGRDFFILPSSINEVIFVPASEFIEREGLDRMVREINEAEVAIEERLSDHAYYYDAQADEIRM